MLKIVHYSTSSKKAPFIEWRDQLDQGVRSIVLTRIARMRMGNFGDCKQLKSGGGIWELRIS